MLPKDEAPLISNDPLKRAVDVDAAGAGGRRWGVIKGGVGGLSGEGCSMPGQGKRCSFCRQIASCYAGYVMHRACLLWLCFLFRGIGLW